jgi:hypothetical protein
MTEQNQNPEATEDLEDTEGHWKKPAVDDPERADAMADDTEGHSRMREAAYGEGDEGDDTEGHWRAPR